MVVFIRITLVKSKKSLNKDDMDNLERMSEGIANKTMKAAEGILLREIFLEEKYSVIFAG